jgi:hypothetical protein
VTPYLGSFELRLVEDTGDSDSDLITWNRAVEGEVNRFPIMGPDPDSETPYSPFVDAIADLTDGAALADWDSYLGVDPPETPAKVHIHVIDPASGTIVEDRTIVADADGAFTFTPGLPDYGEYLVQAQGELFDYASNSYTPTEIEQIEYEWVVEPAAEIVEFGTWEEINIPADDETTGDEEAEAMSSPYLAGQIDPDSRFASLAKIEFDHDGDGLSDGSVWADAAGYFEYEPLGLAAGDVTITATATRFDPRSLVEVDGPGRDYTFEYEPLAAPDVSLEIVTPADDAGPLRTTVVIDGSVVADDRAPVEETDHSDIYVEYDWDGDAVADGAAITDELGEFSFRVATPFGDAQPVAARSSIWDEYQNAFVYSDWRTIVVAAADFNVAVADFTVLDLARATEAAELGYAIDPAITGQISEVEAVGLHVIDFDHDGDQIVDGSVEVNSDGSFTYVPLGLTPGPVTISARARGWDYTSRQDITGDWESLSFTYGAPENVAPTITTFALRSDTGVSNTDNLTANSLLHGQVDNVEGLTDLMIEIDLDDDGVGDHLTFTDESGQFFVQPVYELGEHTVAARAVEWDEIDGEYLFSGWSSFTFTLEVQTAAPPTVTGLNVHNGQLSGRIIDDGPLGDRIIDIDLDGDGTIDLSTMTDRTGGFSLTLPDDGSVGQTIGARGRDGTDEGGAGPWSTIGSNDDSGSQSGGGEGSSEGSNGGSNGGSSEGSNGGSNSPSDPASQIVTNLHLVNDTGASDSDLVTSDPTVSGLVDGGSQVVVELDHDGDSEADTTVTTTASGHFTYAPSDLDDGGVTIYARVLGDTRSIAEGGWASISFVLADDPAAAAAQLLGAAIRNHRDAMVVARAAYDAAIQQANDLFDSAAESLKGDHSSGVAQLQQNKEQRLAAADQLYQQQLGDADTDYQMALAAAEQQLQVDLANFAGDPTSFPIEDLTWNAPPPSLARQLPDDEDQLTAPRSMPDYAGPDYAFDADVLYVQQAAGDELSWLQGRRSGRQDWRQAVRQSQFALDSALDSTREQHRADTAQAALDHENQVLAPHPWLSPSGVVTAHQVTLGGAFSGYNSALETAAGMASAARTAANDMWNATITAAQQTYNAAVDAAQQEPDPAVRAELMAAAAAAKSAAEAAAHLAHRQGLAAAENNRMTTIVNARMQLGAAMDASESNYIAQMLLHDHWVSANTADADHVLASGQTRRDADLAKASNASAHQYDYDQAAAAHFRAQASTDVWTQDDVNRAAARRDAVAAVSTARPGDAWFAYRAAQENEDHTYASGHRSLAVDYTTNVWTAIRAAAEGAADAVLNEAHAWVDLAVAFANDFETQLHSLITDGGQSDYTFLVDENSEWFQAAAEIEQYDATLFTELVAVGATLIENLSGAALFSDAARATAIHQHGRDEVDALEVNVEAILDRTEVYQERVNDLERTWADSGVDAGYAFELALGQSSLDFTIDSADNSQTRTIGSAALGAARDQTIADEQQLYSGAEIQLSVAWDQNQIDTFAAFRQAVSSAYVDAMTTWDTWVATPWTDYHQQRADAEQQRVDAIDQAAGSRTSQVGAEDVTWTETVSQSFHDAVDALIDAGRNDTISLAADLVQHITDSAVSGKTWSDALATGWRSLSLSLNGVGHTYADDQVTGDTNLQRALYDALWNGERARSDALRDKGIGAIDADALAARIETADAAQREGEATAVENYYQTVGADYSAMMNAAKPLIDSQAQDEADADKGYYATTKASVDTLAGRFADADDLFTGELTGAMRSATSSTADASHAFNSIVVGLETTFIDEANSAQNEARELSNAARGEYEVDYFGEHSDKIVRAQQSPDYLQNVTSDPISGRASSIQNLVDHQTEIAAHDHFESQGIASAWDQLHTNLTGAIDGLTAGLSAGFSSIVHGLNDEDRSLTTTASGLNSDWLNGLVAAAGDRGTAETVAGTLAQQTTGDRVADESHAITQVTTDYWTDLAGAESAYLNDVGAAIGDRIRAGEGWDNDALDEDLEAAATAFAVARRPHDAAYVSGVADELIATSSLQKTALGGWATAVGVASTDFQTVAHASDDAALTGVQLAESNWLTGVTQLFADDASSFAGLNHQLVSSLGSASAALADDFSAAAVQRTYAGALSEGDYQLEASADTFPRTGVTPAGSDFSPTDHVSSTAMAVVGSAERNYVFGYEDARHHYASAYKTARAEAQRDTAQADGDLAGDLVEVYAQYQTQTAFDAIQLTSDLADNDRSTALGDSVTLRSLESQLHGRSQTLDDSLLAADNQFLSGAVAAVGDFSTDRLEAYKDYWLSLVELDEGSDQAPLDDQLTAELADAELGAITALVAAGHAADSQAITAWNSAYAGAGADQYGAYDQLLGSAQHAASVEIAGVEQFQSQRIVAQQNVVHDQIAAENQWRVAASVTEADRRESELGARASGMNTFSGILTSPWANYQTSLAAAESDAWQLSKQAYLHLTDSPGSQADVNGAHEVYGWTVAGAFGQSAGDANASWSIWADAAIGAGVDLLGDFSSAELDFIDSLSAPAETADQTLAAAERDYSLAVAQADRDLAVGDIDAAAHTNRLAAAAATRDARIATAELQFDVAVRGAENQLTVDYAASEVDYVRQTNAAELSHATAREAAFREVVHAESDAYVTRQTDISALDALFAKREADDKLAEIGDLANTNDTPWANRDAALALADRDRVFAETDAFTAYLAEWNGAQSDFTKGSASLDETLNTSSLSTYQNHQDQTATARLGYYTDRQSAEQDVLDQGALPAKGANPKRADGEREKPEPKRTERPQQPQPTTSNNSRPSLDLQHFFGQHPDSVPDSIYVNLETGRLFDADATEATESSVPYRIAYMAVGRSVSRKRGDDIPYQPMKLTAGEKAWARHHELFAYFEVVRRNQLRLQHRDTRLGKTVGRNDDRGRLHVGFVVESHESVKYAGKRPWNHPSGAYWNDMWVEKDVEWAPYSDSGYTELGLEVQRMFAEARLSARLHENANNIALQSSESLYDFTIDTASFGFARVGGVGRLTREIFLDGKVTSEGIFEAAAATAFARAIPTKLPAHKDRAVHVHSHVYHEYKLGKPRLTISTPSRVRVGNAFSQERNVFPKSALGGDRDTLIARIVSPGDDAARELSRGEYLRRKYSHLTPEQRALRLDELSEANYLRLLNEKLAGQEYVFRYLTNRGLASSYRHNGVQGYTTLEFTASASEVARRAQILADWNNPALGPATNIRYGVAIPVTKLRKYRLARPFGDQADVGWEFTTYAYPEAGPGGWTQFLIDSVPLDEVFIFTLR